MALAEFPDIFDSSDETASLSGVHLDKSVTITLNPEDNAGNVIDNREDFLRNPYINKFNVDILNKDGTTAYANFLENYQSPTITFTEADNIKVFNNYEKDFKIRVTMVDRASNEHVSLISFSGNFLEASGAQVQDYSGTYSYDSTASWSKTNVNSTSKTGGLSVTFDFENDPTYTKYDHLEIFIASSSAEFDPSLNTKAVFSRSLLNAESQSFEIPESALPNEEPFYIHVKPFSAIGAGTVQTLGPHIVKHQPLVTGRYLTTDDDIGGNQNLDEVLNVGNTSTTGFIVGSSEIQGDLTLGGNIITNAETTMGSCGENLNLKGYYVSLQHCSSSSEPETYLQISSSEQVDFYKNANFSVGASLPNDTLLRIGSSQIYSKYAGGQASLYFSSDKFLFGVSGSSSESSEFWDLRNELGSYASTIILGTKNRVYGDYDAIVAGTENVISGDDNNSSNFNFIGAGSGIDITGSSYSSSIGGYNNDIFNSNHSIIAGGYSNLITGDDSHVGNDASFSSFIGGGESNSIYAAGASVIAGGLSHVISGYGYSFIGGGEGNVASGSFDSIIGGENNTVIGDNSFIAAGNSNYVSGSYSTVIAGQRGRAIHNGAVVLGDGQARDKNSSSDHSLTIDFANGVTMPTGDLTVVENITMTGSTVATQNWVTEQGYITSETDDQTLQEILDIDNSATGTINVDIFSGYSGVFDAIQSTGDLLFNDGDIFLKSDGRVGLGVTPSMAYVKLDVGSSNNDNVNAAGYLIGGGSRSIGTFGSLINYYSYNGHRFTTWDSSIGQVERLRIISNGNVGINDGTPSYTLDVNGTGRFVNDLYVDADLDVTGDITMAGNTVLTGITSNDVTTALGYTPVSSETDSQDLDSVLGYGNTSASNISVGAITGTALNIDTDTLYVDAANNRVGIGTTTPAKKLTIATSGAGDGLQLETTSGNTYAVLYNTNSETFPVGLLNMYWGSNNTFRAGASNNEGFIRGGSSSAGKLSLQCFTQTVATVRDGGFGIFYTDPSYELDVSGSGHFLNDLIVDGSLTAGSTTVDGDLDVSGSATITATGGTEVFSVDGSNGRLFGVTDEVTGTVFSVNDAAGLPIVEVESTADYDKITIGEYGSDALVISGTNSAIFNVDVDITGGLDVTGDITMAGNIVLTGITSSEVIDALGYTPLASETDDQTLQEILNSGNSATGTINVDVFSGESGVFHNTLRVGDAGFVNFPSNYDTLQVGTSSQATNGHILIRGQESSLTFRGAEGADTAHTIKEDAGSLSFYGDTTLSGTAGNLRFTVQTGQSYFTDLVGVRANGVKPQFYLASTAGGAQNKATHFYHPTNSADFRIAVDGSHHGTIGDDVFTIQSSTRNVGIGTTSPDHPLEVTGNIRGDSFTIGTDVVYSNDLNITNAGKIRIGNAEFFSKSSNDLNIYQGRAFVTNGGDFYVDTDTLYTDATNDRVGVNTDSPEAALHVYSGDAIIGRVGTSSPNSTLTVAGYDDFGLDFKAHSTWTHWKARVGHGKNFELYNDGANNKNQTLQLGKTNAEQNAKVRIFSTGVFMDVGRNNNFGIASFGVNAINSYVGDLYLDIRSSTTVTDRFEFNRGGEFIASGIGVGYTSPSYELDVNGTGHFAYDLYVDADLDVTGDITMGGNIVLTGITSSEVIDALGYTPLASETDDQTLHEVLSTGNVSSLGIHVGEITGSALDITGDATITGDVGIGVSNPSSALDILGEIEIVNVNDGIAIGSNVTASGTDTMAIGVSSTATGSRSIAIGTNNVSDGSNYSISMGYDNESHGYSSIAIGALNEANVNNGVVLGRSNIVDADAVTLGTDNIVGAGVDVTIGDSNQVTGTLASVVGADNVVNGNYSQVFGMNNQGSFGSILFGNNNDGGTAFGSSNTTSGSLAMVFGHSNITDANRAVGLGNENEVYGNHSAAIGYRNTVSGAQSYSFGYNCDIGDYDYVLSAGSANSVGNQQTVALGRLNVSSSQYSVVIGSANNNSDQYATSVGTSNRTAYSSSTYGYDNDATGSYATALGYKNLAVANYSLALGSSNNADLESDIAIGNSNSVSGSASTALGYNNDVFGGYRSTAIGYTNSVSGSSSVALGGLNQVEGGSAVALGYVNKASSNSVAVGTSSDATGNSSVAVGHNVHAVDTEAIAYGVDSDAYGTYSMAIGRRSKAYESFSYAIGNAICSGANSTALGYSAKTYADNTVAIGQRVVVGTDNTIEIGKYNYLYQREGAVRIHDNGLVALTMRSGSAPTASTAVSGYEESTTLANDMYTIQRNGSDYFLYHNDGSSIVGTKFSTELSDLTDVSITAAPSGYDVIYYDDGTSQFVNGSLASAGIVSTADTGNFIYSSDAGDVDITGGLDVTGSITMTGATVATQAWVTEQGYLTSETDEQDLNSVLGYGNSSELGISVGAITGSALTVAGNIELGSVATPTDTTADGGGITLKGATDKTIKWYDATNAWTSNQTFIVDKGTTNRTASLSDGGLYMSRTSDGANVNSISANASNSNNLDIKSRSNISLILNSNTTLIASDAGKVAINNASVGDQKLYVNGDVKIDQIDAATTDTDKFIVSDAGVIKFRTGSEVLSDIGGLSTTTASSTYLPLTGGSLSGDLSIEKNTPVLTLGTINSTTGNAKIQLYSKNDGVANGYAIQFTKGTGVDRLDFIDGSGNPRIVFKNGGFVGIGTTGPSSKLHVYDTFHPSTSVDYITSKIYSSGQAAANGYTRTGLDVETLRTGWFNADATAGNFKIANNHRIGNSSLIGVKSVAELDVNNEYTGVSAAGSLTAFYGQISLSYTSGESPVSAGYGMRLDAPVVQSNTSIGTYYGIYIDGASTSGTVSNKYAFVTESDAGNVGIGTASPDSRLQVAGTVKIGSSSESSYSLRLERQNNTVTQDAHFFCASNNSPKALFIEGGYWTGEEAGTVTAANNGYAYYESYFGNGSSSTYKDFGFVESNGSFSSVDLASLMRFTSNGRVGIGGVTVPAAVLDVTSLGTTGEVRIGRSASQYISFSGDASADTITNTNSKPLRIISNAAQQLQMGAGSADDLVIDVGGNVGIGTDTPQRVLDVYLGTDSAVASIGGQISVGEYAGLHFGYSEDGNSSYRKSAIVFERTDSTSNNAQGKVHILNGPQIGSNSATLADAKLTIDEAGNVGIGTTSPDYELHVIGTASFTDTVAGAYFEENASHPSLKKLDTGTILVMNEEGQLVPCSKADDTMVFGVSKHGYKQPIVMGAEPIKVTGPIKVGDYITTSDIPGHGKKSNQPYPFGTIIAQAMESGDGESYNIKAMIRKM